MERNGKPVSSLLQQISSLTGGRSRKLDLGSAKAAAQHVNSAPVQALHMQLTSDLETCKAFELAYAKRLNLENSMLGHRPSKQAATTGGTASNAKATRRSSGSADDGSSGPRPIPMAESAFGSKLAKDPQKIPPIPKGSGLLRGTQARGKYREAMIAHADDVAAHANDVATRSCGYPSSGPGLLRPAATAWENLRSQHENAGKGKKGGNGATRRRPASAPRLPSSIAKKGSSQSLCSQRGADRVMFKGAPVAALNDGHGRTQAELTGTAIGTRRASVDGAVAVWDDTFNSMQPENSGSGGVGWSDRQQMGTFLPPRSEFIPGVDVPEDERGDGESVGPPGSRRESLLDSFRQPPARTSTVSHSSLLRALYKIDGTG